MPDASTATASTETQPMTEGCDVFVIGGGPAGATIATLLAQQGRDVVLVDKEHHPRFHIGESLLPANVELFRKLGVLDQINAIGMEKWGIEFVSLEHEHRSYVEFGDAWDKSMPMAWQVRRSEMDEVLFRNAAARGARTVEGCKVRDVQFDGDGATIQARMEDGASRSWRARFVVDASGRDTVLANKFKSKKKNPKHNSTAVFAHFRNARRLEGKLEGNVSICWFPHGWIWFIPLADGTTSVGAVCWPYYLKSRDKPMKEFFFDTLAMAPELADRLKNAELVDDAVHATGNFAYDGTHATGERYLMLGDAFSFVDPMFSTGVLLAMHNAFDGAELIATALERPAQYPKARRAYEAMVRRAPREYTWFIYRATNPTIRDMFMNQNNIMRIKEAVLSLLAGDIYGNTPFWWGLRRFKLVYYLISWFNPRRTWRGWRRHHVAIRDMGRLQGETIQTEG